jgi:hypothetical protein
VRMRVSLILDAQAGNSCAVDIAGLRVQFQWRAGGWALAEYDPRSRESQGGPN